MPPIALHERPAPSVFLCMKLLTLPILAATLCWAQDVERVYTFSQIDNAQDLDEVSVIVRVISEIGSLRADPERRTITYAGTADQVLLADRLMSRLDRPAKAQPSAPVEIAATEGELVKLYYLRHMKSSEELQEVALIIRALSGVPRSITHPSRSTVIVGGPAQPLTLAAWLLAHLDVDGEIKPDEYRVPGEEGEVVRLFSLPAALTPEQMQDVAVQLRNVTGLPRALTFNRPHILAVRGPAAQVAQAAKIIQPN